MLYSARLGVTILRRWDLTSGSELQLALERRTYLVSTILTNAFGFQLVSLFLLVFTADRLHTQFVGAMCATGSLNANPVGWTALAVELPITTTIIMRSIADIARSQGEDLRQIESRLACLEVFAMGGTTDADDAAESGYFAVRAALAQAVSEAAKYVARKAVVEDGAPVIVRLLAQIAARFNTVVGEKILAQGVPVLGAVGGATVNVLFIEHFQDMARGHFIVRRLERQYGEDEVRRKYDELLGRR